MGLDAVVYCNCFEVGKLRTPPPADFDVHVSDDGGLECRSSDLETQLTFDAWQFQDACEHERGILLHHRIGNVSAVGLLRQKLSRQADDFPIILKQILYSGSHAGDFLSMEDIRELQDEMPRLKKLQCGDREAQVLLDRFYDQLNPSSSAGVGIEVF